MTEYELLQDLEMLYPHRQDWKRKGDYRPAERHRDGVITIQFRIKWDEKDDEHGI